MNIAALRADTPGCENLIHLNNAGSSLPPRVVVERVKQHLDLEAAMGGYEAADHVAEENERIYTSIARMLGCAPHEIALMESATRAWDSVFYALAQRFQPGDVVLTLGNEFVNNFIAHLHAAQNRGIEIVILDAEPTGEISLPALEHVLEKYGSRAKLISLTHVPTHGGLVQPAAAVGRIARKFGVPFLLDACQSAGQMPLNVEELGCDMLSATGRKYMRGPRGTGFLYVRQSFLPQLEPAMLDMRSADWVARNRYEIRNDARRFENWECSLACRLGLGVAVEYALAVSLDAIQERNAMLAANLRRELSAIPGITVQDLPASATSFAQQPQFCGIVTFTHERLAAQQIFAQLRERKIQVRVTPVFGSRIDMEQRGLPEMVRASVHYYNTAEEPGPPG